MYMMNESGINKTFSFVINARKKQKLLFILFNILKDNNIKYGKKMFWKRSNL